MPLDRLFVKEISLLSIQPIRWSSARFLSFWHLNYTLILFFSAISPLVQRSHNSGQFSVLLQTNSSNIKFTSHQLEITFPSKEK